MGQLSLLCTCTSKVLAPPTVEQLGRIHSRGFTHFFSSVTDLKRECRRRQLCTRAMDFSLRDIIYVGTADFGRQNPVIPCWLPYFLLADTHYSLALFRIRIGIAF